MAFSLFSATAAKKIPVEDFFKDNDFVSVQLSLDGTYLTGILEKEGKQRLVVLNRKTMKPENVISMKGREEVAAVVWLNNERFMFTTQIREGKLSTARGTGIWYATNYDGSKEQQLVGKLSTGPVKNSNSAYGFQVLNRLIDDDKHILIVETQGEGKFKLKKLNHYSGYRKKIMSLPGRGSRAITDHNQVLRFVVGRDSKNSDITYIYYRANGEEDFKVIKKLDFGEVAYRPIAFTKDNKKVYVLNQTAGKRGIYLLDPKDGSMEPIWVNKSIVETGSLIYDDDYRKTVPIGVMLQDGKPSYHYFDESHPKAQFHRGLEKAFPGQNVYLSKATTDGNLTQVLVTSDRNPGELYLYDKKKNQMKFVLAYRPWVKAKQMASMEPISYETRDGLTIHGYLTMPNNKKKNAPLIVKVHGGPFGERDYWGYDPEDQFFASRGYATLKVNFRGSGGYGLDFVMDAFGKTGKEMQDDVTDATLWAIKQGYADKDKICIYGASYGGYASLMGVVKEPDLYKCAIPYVGVYDITKLDDWGFYSTDKDSRKSIRRMWGDDDEQLKLVSPINYLDRLKAGLFVIHGKLDRQASYKHYELLIDMLDDIDYPYESMYVRNEGHGFYIEKNKFKLYKKMERFLAKYLD
jgi:dipeptidyl aminopeptidase/acylaminoacyl peptidase